MKFKKVLFRFFCSFSIFILLIENTVYADTVHFRNCLWKAAGYGDILLGTGICGILDRDKMEQACRLLNRHNIDRIEKINH